MTNANTQTIKLSDDDLADIDRLAQYATQGEWELQTSNSMRRIGTKGHDGNVLYATQNRHDLVIDLGGPYANLEYIVRMQPLVAKALVDEVRHHRKQVVEPSSILSPIPKPWPERREGYAAWEQPHSDHLQGLELEDWREWGARVRYLTQRVTPSQAAQMARREQALEELMHKHELIGVLGDNPRLESRLLAFVSDALALASGLAQDGTPTQPESVAPTHVARRWCKGDGEWTDWALIGAAEYSERKDDPSFQVIALEPPAGWDGNTSAQAVEDAFIVDAVREAKVLCVHPQAATTIDIGRAVLSSKRRAAQAAAPGVHPADGQAEKTGTSNVLERHSIEGTVRFQREDKKPGVDVRKCICCPDGHHIFSRGVKWDQYDTKHPAHFGDGPDVFVSSRVTSKNANEGRRVRLTVEVLDASPEPADTGLKENPDHEQLR